MIGRGLEAVGNFVTSLFSPVSADKKTVDEWKKLQQSTTTPEKNPEKEV